VLLSKLPPLLLPSDDCDAISESLSADAAVSESGMLSPVLAARLALLSLLHLNTAFECPWKLLLLLLCTGPVARLKSPSSALPPDMKTFSGLRSLCT
jgi:hypothetical protein